MRKYNKKEYLKYVKELKKDDIPDLMPISFKDWKWVQPIADEVVGKVNKIIKNHISKKKEYLRDEKEIDI